MNIAIIPARSGSKRIKDKNIKEFCGKPIIAYAINSALESSIFDKVIVSTNSTNIAEIAKAYGAKVPHLRSEDLSDDYTSTLDVISYEAEHLKLASDDIVCCIYATTPLLQVQFLQMGLERLKKDSYLFSACEFSPNPLRGFYIKGGGIKLVREDLELARTQDLEELYYDAGQFYFGYAKLFLDKKPIFSEDSTPMVLPSKYVLDINTHDDWEIAEIKYKILCK